MEAGPAARAQAVLVLAGDPSGSRILVAAGIVKAGLAPKAFISGPSGQYGEYECEPAIRFAVRRGFPESWFACLPHDARSTREEAADVIPELRRMGIRDIDLVTSDFHTRRAGGDFRAAAPDLRFHVVAAPDRYFTPGAWWRNREGRKTFVIEWMKTVATWIGL